MFFDMKRLRTIEKDFVLKPNPYVTEEQSTSVLWKLAVGEVLAISAFSCLALTLLKIKPSITAANSFKNLTYFQGATSIGILYYHIYELDQLAKTTIPEVELTEKMKTYDQRYHSWWLYHFNILVTITFISKIEVAMGKECKWML